MNNFFTTKDDFSKIIKSVLKNVTSIEQISTGWTNFVYRVKSNNSHYIFRFPRNNFFSNALIKEAIFSQYIQGKLTYKTTNLTIHYDKDRPFSIHEEIKGKTMTDLYDKLTHEHKKNIAREVSKFIYEIQHLPISYLNLDLETTSSFLTRLSKVDDQKYDLTKLNPLINLEKDQLVLSHADLNPGNILLDENYKVCGILDFAFVSLTHPLNDVARLIGRLPKDFYDIMIKEYNDIHNITIDTKDIDNIIKVWNHVEYHYMIYMKNHHPEIKF